jgi:hypothetical protein
MLNMVTEIQNKIEDSLVSKLNQSINTGSPLNQNLVNNIYKFDS